MSQACTPILVDGASPVSEILVPSKTANFPFLTMDYSPWFIKKFNWLESAQKIPASKDWCHKHTHQFWWAVPLRFRRYYYLQKWPIFPLWPCMDYIYTWTIVHGHQKINWSESAQKIQVSRDWCLIHVHHFGGLDFFCFGDTGTFKNGQFSLSDHGQ